MLNVKLVVGSYVTQFMDHICVYFFPNGEIRTMNRSAPPLACSIILCIITQTYNISTVLSDDVDYARSHIMPPMTFYYAKSSFDVLFADSCAALNYFFTG